MPEIFALFAVFAAALILLSIYYNKQAVVKRKLRKAVGKKISEFIDGDIARVVGKVELTGQPLIAPLSGRKCGYYFVEVEQRDNSNSGQSSQWRTIIEQEVVGSFLLQDGKYRAHINRSRIKSYLVEDREYYSGFKDDATETLENYLQQHGYSSKNFLGFNKRMSYREGILEEGELVAVVGRGEWKFARDLGLNESFGKVLVIGPPEKQAVYLSDDPESVKTIYSDI